MSNIPTPHIACDDVNKIAKVVLMPGDPLRAKFIAENFLTDVTQFTSTRNIYGYTGKYKGKWISVMGSGMGQPSIGIYSYELFKFYDVDTIVRIGSAGAYVGRLNVYDTVLVTEAYSESTFAKVAWGIRSKKLKSSKSINNKLIKAAEALNIELKPAVCHRDILRIPVCQIVSIRNVGRIARVCRKGTVIEHYALIVRIAAARSVLYAQSSASAVRAVSCHMHRIQIVKRIVSHLIASAVCLPFRIMSETYGICKCTPAQSVADLKILIVSLIPFKPVCIIDRCRCRNILISLAYTVRICRIGQIITFQLILGELIAGVEVPRCKCIIISHGNGSVDRDILSACQVKSVHP